MTDRYGRRDIEAAIENSLHMLDVEYVDLYQIHGRDPQYPVEESMEAMARVQQQGKTRALGVSNFNSAQMQRALQTAWFQSNQPRYNMLDRSIEAEDLPFCEKRGIGVLAHSPLGQGLLSGRYAANHRFPADDTRSQSPWHQGQRFAHYLAIAERLKELASDKGISLVQLAIAWILRMPAISCVLVGAKSPRQVHEHVGAADVSFTDEELTRIETILEAAAYDD